MSSGDRVNYAVNRLFTMLFNALCLLFTVGRALCPAESGKRFLCGKIGFLQNYVSYKTQPFITAAKDKPSPYGGEINFRDRANYTVKTSFAILFHNFFIKKAEQRPPSGILFVFCQNRKQRGNSVIGVLFPILRYKRRFLAVIHRKKNVA